MYKYPKIETVFTRDSKFKVTDKIRLPEFKNIKKWLITEKIDGTNIRIIYTPEDKLLIRGRTDNAQIPTFLLEELQNIFTIEKVKTILDNPTEQGMCLYGEGYGAKIQKGGGNYNKGNSFRLFDVWIDGWWLEWDKVEEIAGQLEIGTVPHYGTMSLKTAVSYVADFGIPHYSIVAEQENGKFVLIEGIVARAYPMMLFRNGIPIKWKLKVNDYRKTMKGGY